MFWLWNIFWSKLTADEKYFRALKKSWDYDPKTWYLTPKYYKATFWTMSWFKTKDYAFQRSNYYNKQISWSPIKEFVYKPRYKNYKKRKKYYNDLFF